MFILKNPEIARQSGLISAKAQLAGIADWPSFFHFLTQAVAAGGLMLFGFITSWVFGREYSNRTLKDLLALPISRIHIVSAKFLLVFLWSIFLSLLVFILGLGVGKLVGLPGWTVDIAWQEWNIFAVCSVLTIVLSTPVAFFACIGRGYLTPLGFVISMLVLAQVFGVIGYGQYFPWAVPVMYSEIAGNKAVPLETISYILVGLTSLLGLAGTSLWWRFADHT